MEIDSISAKEALKTFFGFDTFKGKQEEVVNTILRGDDCFVIMPTGAGKSLCYQLPALMLEGTAIVISPLIALMKNQVDQIRGFGGEEGIAHFLNSSLSKADNLKVKEDILKGQTKILYIAPETLKKEETIDFLRQINVSFIAVDEAHCISEWGHDFRPEYRRIKLIVKELGNVPMMALTATATPKVQADIQKNLHMQDALVFKSSFNRSNLYYEIRNKGNKDNAVKSIVSYIKGKPNRSGIIYCLSRKKVEEIAEILNVNGIKALPYHAGLDAKTRASHQDKFLMEEVNVIVATIAFGMGIDKPDVRFVIHYDVPKSIEGYYQETGRAGRDGLEGECILFYNPADLEKLESFMKDKPVSEREIGEQLIFETQSFVESSSCRRKMLLHYFGESFDAAQCNNMCDNCRHPKPRFDVTNDMVTVLQSCDILQGKFNAQHVAAVLTGTRNQQVLTYGHDALPIFGKGSGHDANYWKALARMALLDGLLYKDIEQYGLLSLTDKGNAYLANPTKVEMALDQSFDRVRDEDEASVEVENIYDEELFSVLKDLRKTIAKEKKLPPYVIFSDPSLEEMATRYPCSLEELTNIPGISQGKASKYGKPFIELIAGYVKENEIERPTDLVIKSVANKSMLKVSIIQNIDKKIGLDDIARSKGMSRDDLLHEVENIVFSGTKLNLSYYINDLLEEDVQDEIIEYFRGTESDSLEEAMKEFDGSYSREELQLMRIQFFSEYAN